MDLMIFQIFSVGKWDKTDSFIGCVFLTSEYFCNITAILLSIFKYNDILKMADHFHSIEKYLYERSRLEINQRKFIKRYLMKILIISFLLVETFIENAYMMFWVYCYIYRDVKSENFMIISNFY